MQIVTTGVVFRPHSPPETLREVVVAAEAAGVAELWLFWEDCFWEGGLHRPGDSRAGVERAAADRYRPAIPGGVAQPGGVGDGDRPGPLLHAMTSSAGPAPGSAEPEPSERGAPS